MRYIPIVTKNLLILNVLFFAASWIFERMGIDLDSLGGLHFFLADNFAIYQFVSYLFLHAGFMHLFFNMFALWMFGCVIENTWGPRRFLTYYLVCGIGAGMLQELAQFFSFYMTLSAQDPTIGLFDTFRMGRIFSSDLNGWTTIGASGAVSGVLLAFGMLSPNERMFVFPVPFPIKAKWFITFYVVLELLMAVGSRGDGVAHVAHLGGMLFGYLLIRHWRNQYGGYSSGFNGQELFRRMRQRFEERRNNKPTTHLHVEEGGRETDWEYNARRQAMQEEVDRILDKIRRSGYDSLTSEEKKRLFDHSREL